MCDVNYYCLSRSLGNIQTSGLILQHSRLDRISQENDQRVTYRILNNRHVIFFLYVFDVCLQSRSVSLFSLLMSFRQSEKASERKKKEKRRTKKKNSENGKKYVLLFLYKESINDLSMLASILLKFSTLVISSVVTECFTNLVTHQSYFTYNV